MSDTIASALRQHLDGQLSGAALLRRVASWEAWCVPMMLVDGRPVPRAFDGPDGPWLALFSSADLLADWAAVGDREEVGQLWATVPGAALLAGLKDGLGGLDLDPSTPHALHYRQAQVPLLRRWGQAVLVERALAGQGGASWELLRSFDGYRVIQRPGEKAPSSLVLAPDPQARRLAAVFTAEDTLDAFLQRHGAALGSGAVVQVLEGATLFRLLAAMPLDGIVFDCCGPISPKAVAPAFARLVLEG